MSIYVRGVFSATGGLQRITWCVVTSFLVIPNCTF